MRFNLVLHEKEITAKAAPVEPPILAEAHMESRLRPRYVVFDVLDLSYGGISVIDIRRRDGI